jgi:hypothetical protein
MSSKAIIPHRKTLPSVADFQTDLGLVHRVKEDGQDEPAHALSSTEVGRLARLPGVWSMKGHHMNLLAQAAGLAVRVNGRWEPTKRGEDHARKVDGRWRWYPSMIDQIKKAAKEHPLEKLMGKAPPERSPGDRAHELA